MSGMGLTQMNSLLTSANTMKSVANMERNRNGLQRYMQALAKEIASAKEAGVDTTVKEEKYNQMENRLNSIEEGIFTTAKDLTERISEDNEKIREEETAKAKADEKAEKAADASKSDNATKTPEPAQTVPTDENADSPTVVVKISADAYNALKNDNPAPNPVSAPSAPVVKPSAGSKLDVKAQVFGGDYKGRTSQ